MSEVPKLTVGEVPESVEHGVSCVGWGCSDCARVAAYKVLLSDYHTRRVTIDVLVEAGLAEKSS